MCVVAGIFLVVAMGIMAVIRRAFLVAVIVRVRIVVGILGADLVFLSCE